MRGFLLDLHCHTREHSPDSEVAAGDLVTGLFQAGFRGVVLTDHNYVWSDDELEALRRDAGLPPGFLLLSGQEVRTAHDKIVHGDLLLFGLREGLPDDVSPVEVFRILREHGGFAVAPHPSLPRIGFGSHLGSFPVTAVEVWNGRYGRKAAAAARRLAADHGLPAVGGSDTHRLQDVGGGGAWFPQPVAGFDELVAAIRSGACRPWKPSLFGLGGGGRPKGGRT